MNRKDIIENKKFEQKNDKKSKEKTIYKLSLKLPLQIGQFFLIFVKSVFLKITLNCLLKGYGNNGGHYGGNYGQGNHGGGHYGSGYNHGNCQLIFVFHL